MSEPDMLTPQEAAEKMGLSLSTFRRRVADGSIPLPKPELGPYLKRPKKLLYNRADVERLAQTAPAKAEPGKDAAEK